MTALNIIDNAIAQYQHQLSQLSTQIEQTYTQPELTTLGTQLAMTRLFMNTLESIREAVEQEQSEVSQSISSLLEDLTNFGAEFEKSLDKDRKWLTKLEGNGDVIATSSFKR